MADFPDFASQYAQLLSDQEKNQRRMQMAQQLMQAGYVPNSGVAGILGSALQSFLGGRMMDKEEGKLSDILKRQFDLQSQQTAAQRQQQMEDEQRKFEREILAAQKKAQAEAQAKRDYAPKEWKDGGIFDPQSGQFTPDPNYSKAQLDLARQKAAIEAGARQPSELERRIALAQQMHASPEQIKALVLGQQGANGPFADIAAALQSGVVTPEQAQQAMREKIGVDVKPQPVSADNRTKLGLLTAAEQALAQYEKGGVDENGAPKAWGNAMSGPANAHLDEAIANLLRVESGAAIGKDEIAQARDRYAPALFGKDDTNKAKLEQFKRKIADMKAAILQGTGAQPQGSAPQQMSDQDLLKKYGGL